MNPLRFTLGLFAGALFGVGLLLSGMTQPSKVAGFLDVTGRWDPSLALVMGGAVAVFALGAFLFRHRERALLGDAIEARPQTRFDVRLIGGSALFGIGWGLSGYCPGPAVVSLFSLNGGLLVFLGTMALTMVAHDRWLARRTRPSDG